MNHRRFLRAITDKTVIGAATILLLCWNEFIYVSVLPLTWNVLHDVNIPENELRSTRILIVADPQLIGYRNELSFIGPISRWDSDRYVRSAYSHAFIHSSPDLVLFLGDLFDEGIEANDQQFEETIKRFHSIFRLPKSVQRVYIPGDNDVGGESEPVLAPLVDRFHRRLSNALDMRMLGLNGVAVKELNVFNSELTNISSVSSEDKLLILLSHSPIVRSFGRAGKIAWEERADLILSAHDHTAEGYMRPRKGSSYSSFQRISLSSDTQSSVIEAIIGRNHPTIEIQSPTCSYRMGVPSMGFGLLTLKTINKDDALELNARFTVLWLPGRYPQLYSYLILLSWIVIVIAQKVVFRCLKKVVVLERKKGHII